MANQYIALLRGINVGRAKRIAMADLRTMIEDLGCRDVRTLLNSGNVVLTKSRTTPTKLASQIEKAIEKEAGFSARTTVLSAEDLAQIVSEKPNLAAATNPSRFLVAFFRDPDQRKLLKPLLKEEWHPDALVLGDLAAYLWCPNGVLKSPISDAFNKLVGKEVTMRNWATVSKLNALVNGS